MNNKMTTPVLFAFLTTNLAGAQSVLLEPGTEVKTLATCESVDVYGHNAGNEISAPIKIELIKEGFDYRLNYSGPSYTLANVEDGEYAISLTNRNISEPSGYPARFSQFRCRNTAIGPICDVSTSFPSAAVDFSFQILGSNATLSYRDGKPIALDAVFKCET